MGVIEINSNLRRRRWGAAAAILGIGLVTVLVGASFPVVRTALMGSIALIDRQFGRQTGINTPPFYHPNHVPACTRGRAGERPG